MLYLSLNAKSSLLININSGCFCVEPLSDMWFASIFYQYSDCIFSLGYAEVFKFAKLLFACFCSLSLCFAVLLVSKYSFLNLVSWGSSQCVILGVLLSQILNYYVYIISYGHRSFVLYMISSFPQNIFCNYPFPVVYLWHHNQNHGQNHETLPKCNESKKRPRAWL